MDNIPLSKKLFAEAFGTFTLVFAGCGAIAINQYTQGSITHAGIALTFGLVVLAMIYTVGDISGAHLNPAVTLAFTAAKRIKFRIALPYMITQIIAAIAACGVLWVLFPDNNQHLGATLPLNDNWQQSFILEVILTFILMYVILCVSTGAKEKGITAGIAIGSIVGLEAMFAGPICGASMNPARSLAPAIVSGNLQHLWLYLVGPIVGALLAIPLCALTQAGPCCVDADQC